MNLADKCLEHGIDIDSLLGGGLKELHTPLFGLALGMLSLNLLWQIALVANQHTGHLTFIRQRETQQAQQKEKGRNSLSVLGTLNLLPDGLALKQDKMR